MLEDRLSAGEQELVARARRFRDVVVAPQAAEWERARRVPREVYEAAAREGLLSIEVPERVGGLGYSYLAKLFVIAELSKADMAFTFSLINLQNVTARLGRAGGRFDEQVKGLMQAQLFGGIALTEPGAGSDFSAIQTHARKVDGGWRLTGEKAWITNIEKADFIITFAQTEPGSRHRGIAGLVVDAREPGFERIAPYGLAGGHAIGAGGFRLTDYFVPDDHLLFPAGEAFRSAMGSLNEARVYVAMMCASMVESALEHAIAYGQTREAFSQPIIQHQGLRFMLADVYADLAAMRALTLEAAERIADGRDAVMHAAAAKSFATRRAPQLVADCIEAMGARGLKDDIPLGRHLACTKIAGFTDGSIEIMRERIGAAFLPKGNA